MANRKKPVEADAPLRDNDDVKQLLSLLSKVEGDRAKEFSQLVKYVDTMEQRFDLVSAELMQVRKQLADMQQSPAKKTLAAAVTGIETSVQTARGSWPLSRTVSGRERPALWSR